MFGNALFAVAEADSVDVGLEFEAECRPVFRRTGASVLQLLGLQRFRGEVLDGLRVEDELGVISFE